MDILVIEDQRKIASALFDGLKTAGFNVAPASDGEEGFFLLINRHFDLVILDLGLPKRDGLEILRAARAKNIRVPVLILTARDSVEDRVQGLETGADDYLVKPFAFPELLARVHALLRRSQQTNETQLVLNDLILDLTTRRVTRSGQHIPLTGKEMELLEYLLRNKESIVSREMLARDIWHAAARATPIDNIIDVHITHLRGKIDGPYDIKLLNTVRGVGYILGPNKP